MRMKGETPETAVYALRAADIPFQSTGPQMDFEQSVIKAILEINYILGLVYLWLDHL